MCAFCRKKKLPNLSMMLRHSLLSSISFLALISYIDGKCVFNGNNFEPYRVVYKVYDEINDWCTVGLCKDNGEVWKLVDLACKRKSHIGTTQSAASTIPVQTTEPGKV